MEPMCMMLIYTIIFGVVFNASEKYFPVFIFIGLTMWSFFSKGVTASVTIVRANKSIITRVYMPKYILLLSRMFVNAFKMMVSFGVIVVMMIFYHIHITRHVLYVIPLLIVLFMFTFGVGTILMHYGVYVNDLSYIIGIVLSMLMYFTGTFYSVSKRIPAPYGSILEKANPLAFLISGMRNALLYGRHVSIRFLTLWGLASIIIIAIGVSIVYKNENSYVKVI
jgi:teichoic acid transport system permease protein